MSNEQAEPEEIYDSIMSGETTLSEFKQWLNAYSAKSTRTSTKTRTDTEDARSGDTRGQ